MADSVATLALKVKSNDASRAVDRFSDRLTNLGGLARSTGAAVAGMFVGSKIAAYGRDWLAAASDAQESAGKFRAVFKTVASDAKKATDELARKYNFSSRKAMDSVSTMADIFQKSGLSIRRSMEYAFNLNKQAADIEAFTNAEGGLEQVTHALTNAMLGFGMSAQRLGVMVKDVDVQSQMLLNNQQGLTFATANAAKMYARYQTIMKNSANATGQVARESENYANRLRRLRSRWQDLKQSLGDSFIRPATKVVNVLTALTDRFNRLEQSTKNAIVWSGAIAAGLAAVTPVVLTLAAGWQTYAAIQTIAATTTANSTRATTVNTAAINAETAAVLENTAAKSANAFVSGSDSDFGTSRRRSTAGYRAGLENALNLNESKLAASRTKERLLEKNRQKLPQTVLNQRLSDARKQTAKLEQAQETLRKKIESFGDLSAGGFGSSTFDSGDRLRRRAAALSDPKYRKIGANMVSASRSKTGVSSSIAAALNLPILKRIASPLRKIFGLFSKFGTSIATKLPLLGRFAGTLGGIFGTGGVIATGIGVLATFKESGTLYEKWLREWQPAALDLGGKLVAWLWEGAKNATTGSLRFGFDFLSGAALGVGQFFKRLAGFETEVSRQYEINKKIKLALAQKKELQELEERRWQAELKLIANGKRINELRTNALLDVWSEQKDDDVKRASIGRKLDVSNAKIKESETRNQSINFEIGDINRQIRVKADEIARIDREEIAAAYRKNGYGYEGDNAAKAIRNQKIAPLKSRIAELEARRAELEEESTLLAESLATLRQDWADQTKSFNELSKSIRETQKDFETRQAEWLKTRAENERELKRRSAERTLATAETNEERQAALEKELIAHNSGIERSIQAGTQANAVNETLSTKFKEFSDEILLNAIASLEDVIASKDFVSENALQNYNAAISNLEKSGYELGNVEFDETNAQRIQGLVLERRRLDLEEIESLTKRRDELQETANRLESLTQTRDGVLDKINELRNAADKAEIDRLEERRRREEKLADYDKALREQIQNDRFDAIYSKANDNEKLPLLSAKLAENDRQIASFRERQATLDSWNRRIDEQDNLFAQGRLNDAQIDSLSKEKSNRDREEEKLQSERLEALKNQSSIESRMDEIAQKIAEKRFESAGKVEKESRRPAESITAIQEGSSEAFRITNRVYGDSQKSIETNTKQIAERSKIMADRLVQIAKESSGDITLDI